MANASKTQSGLIGRIADSGAPPRELVSDSIATGLVFALALTVGQRLIGFGRGLLFCRLMTDQQLGQWSMVWSYLMLLAPLAVLGLPGCFGKYSEHYRQRGQLATFIRRVGWISAAMTVGLSATILAFPNTFSWILFRDSSQASLVVLIAIALVFVTLSNFLSSLMESLRQIRVVTWMRFLTGLVFAVVAIGLLLVMSDGASAATIGFSIACLCGSLPAIWVLWRGRDTLEDSGAQLTHAAMWTRIAPFAVWLWASNLLNNLFEVADRYMLIHYSRLPADAAQGAVGQYHSGRVVPLLLVGVAMMLAGLLLPYLSAAWEAGKRRQAQQQLNWTIKLIAVAFTAGGWVILILAPPLFSQVLEGRYQDGLAVLPLTLVYCIWFSLHTVGQDYLWVAEKGKWAATATGIGLALNIGLNVALIPAWGLQGAVIATAAGNLLVVVIMFTLNHRFGCSTDLGIWVCAAIPLLLLLDVAWASVAIVFLVWVCGATTLVFNASEKQAIQQQVESRLPTWFRR